MGQTLLDIENAIGSIGHAAASAPVTIGELVLTGMEVPDRLQVGGRQMLVVHRLPGGARVVDALGNDPGRLELRGRFFGPEAQGRAQQIERMRMSGRPVPFSAAGLSLQVWIAQFVYSYEAKGALCSYSLVLERPAEQQLAAVSSSVTDLIGGDTGAALRGLSDVVGAVSQGVFTAVGQAETVVGQVMPLATMLGVGGAVAKVSDALGVANGLAQTGTNIGQISASLTAVASGLGTVVSQSADNLAGVTLGSTASLGAVAGNAGLMSSAVDAMGYVGRAQNRIGALTGAGH